MAAVITLAWLAMMIVFFVSLAKLRKTPLPPPEEE